MTATLTGVVLTVGPSAFRNRTGPGPAPCGAALRHRDVAGRSGALPGWLGSWTCRLPDFVLALRSAVGHRPPAADRRDCCGAQRSLARCCSATRSDNGQWALVSGILEPGEQPAEALLREIEEETGVRGQHRRPDGVWIMPAWSTPTATSRSTSTSVSSPPRVRGGRASTTTSRSRSAGSPRTPSPRACPSPPGRKLQRALAFDGTTWFESAVAARRAAAACEGSAGHGVARRAPPRCRCAGPRARTCRPSWRSSPTTPRGEPRGHRRPLGLPRRLRADRRRPGPPARGGRRRPRGGRDAAAERDPQPLASRGAAGTDRGGAGGGKPTGQGTRPGTAAAGRSRRHGPAAARSSS